jgi:hypothetical protein
MPRPLSRALPVVFLSLILLVALPGAAAAYGVPAADDGPPVIAQAAAEENDDLVPVAVGTAVAVAIAAAVVTIGYLYRRQTGQAARYDDGFTPRDPRDHPVH